MLKNRKKCLKTVHANAKEKKCFWWCRTYMDLYEDTGEVEPNQQKKQRQHDMIYADNSDPCLFPFCPVNRNTIKIG